MRCRNETNDLRCGQNRYVVGSSKEHGQIYTVLYYFAWLGIIDNGTFFRCLFSWVQSHSWDDHSEDTCMNANSEGTSYILPGHA